MHRYWTDAEQRTTVYLFFTAITFSSYSRPSGPVSSLFRLFIIVGISSYHLLFSFPSHLIELAFHELYKGLTPFLCSHVFVLLIQREVVVGSSLG